jgi:hypothetical protein
MCAHQAQLHGVLAALRDIGAVITELRATPEPVRIGRSVLERPLRTERLTLRPATAEDAEATWKYRRLESVNEWLTGRPADLAGYRKLFSEPARLASTVIITLGHGAAAPIIGDFMLRREDVWAQLDVTDQAHSTRAELSHPDGAPPASMPAGDHCSIASTGRGSAESGAELRARHTSTADAVLASG